MANYTIDRSLAANGSVTVTEATTDTSTNVTLIGQNFTGYGDEIATNFLQMLENFAADIEPNSNPRVPGSNAITGQLWYDTGNNVLKVFGGTTWEEQAKTNSGTVESSTLRWNDTNGRWQEEERVRVSDAGSLIIANTSGASPAVTMNQGATDFAMTFAGTTDFTISGLSGDLTVTGGRGLSVEQGSGALAIRHDGTDANVTTANTSNINLPATVKLQTAASTTTRAGMNIAEGVAPTSPVDGDVWVTAGGQFLARLNGVTVDLSAAAGGTVTSTGSPSNNELAVWTAVSDQLEGDPNLTWNGTTFNVTGAITATSFGGIASANLLDKNAVESINGVFTFNNGIVLGGDIDLQDNDRILFGTGDDVEMDFDGTDLVISANTATDFNITGFSGNVVSDRPVYATSGGADAIRVIGDATTWSTADSYISFYDSDQGEHGFQIGTRTSDATAAVVNARLGQLNLLASNTQVANFQSSQATFTSAGATSLELRNSFTSNNTTSAAVTDNNGNLHNVGYNETPEANSVSDNINTGSRTLSNISIGKIFIRTTSTSRTLTLPNDANIPIGATVLVNNDTGSGTFTIVEGGGVTLEWVDGSGSSAPTGTRTLAQNSIATIRKKSNTEYQIWGNGIS